MKKFGTMTAADIADAQRRGEEVMAANSNPGHAGRPGMRGGSAPRGGSESASLLQKYKDNENANAHSENAHLLASRYGNEHEAQIAKSYMALHQKLGSATKSGTAFQSEMSAKYFPKLREDAGELQNNHALRLRAKANEASANAWNKSKIADYNSSGHKELVEASNAHHVAQGVHEDAAKYHLERSHDGIGKDTRAEDASDHQTIARVHEREAMRHRGEAEIYGR